MPTLKTVFECCNEHEWGTPKNVICSQFVSHKGCPNLCRRTPGSPKEQNTSILCVLNRFACSKTGSRAVPFQSSWLSHCSLNVHLCREHHIEQHEHTRVPFEYQAVWLRLSTKRLRLSAVETTLIESCRLARRFAFDQSDVTRCLSRCPHCGPQ